MLRSSPPPRVRSSAATRGERVLDRARARVQRAVGEVVLGSIEALAERLPDELSALQAVRARRTPDAAERLRSVLQIDRHTQALEERALRVATAPLPADPKMAPPSQAVQAGAGESCDEPIRTRSMARLLAAQGHPQRALAIIEYLLARNATDAELQAEAAALRAQLHG